MIALLTDFRHSDCLGVAKAVMKSVNPRAEIIDITNEITPFNVKSAAWVLLKSCRYFPKSTVFYCVVDPGVGGQRKAIAVKTRNYHFVGPDNGLMFPAANDDGIQEIVELPIPEGASNTFHGRDVFAPAAAKLDKGVKIEDMGNELSQLQQLDVGSSDGKGEVVLIEHYGNIVTNISSNDKEAYEVECDSFKKNLKFYATFEEATEGEMLVFVGSRGTLELAVNRGNAAEIVKCKVGDRITIR